MFSRTESNWTQQTYIKSSNAEAGDEFGASLALSGNTLAIGAPFESAASTGVNANQNNNDAFASGAVYVFSLTGSNWIQQAYIKASNTSMDDRFGQAIALSGDTLAIGARFEDSASTGANADQNNNDAVNSGAVYVRRVVLSPLP